MKLVTFEQAGRIGIGLLRDDQIIDLTALAPDMIGLIELGEQGAARARAMAGAAVTFIPLTDVKLLAPIHEPRRNVMCVGKNYAEHTRESYEARGENVEAIDYPVIFTKTTTCINGPYDDIPYNATVSEKIDYEAELAVIIGRRVKNATREEAQAAVFGYTVLNDVTARDLQTLHKQFFKGKSLDGSCPIGPWIVTADEIADPYALRITCRVNGELRQDSTAETMTFDIPTIIGHLSRGMTLLPGDIIATGTPSGVGFAMKPPVFLRPGDVVECAIEGIGAIRNRIALAA
ncbi:MAG: fumarylacetoacetate hydrolase family protein [Anaerolineae bacterium]|uniref:fumarylacetoacetate hydrolase family protein n=1 Tax=Promineifilum sp. TaxID=2664178 RepID=UPI002411FD3A|nr:fumarylacetoacetate hydrolase family protein [Promineifilum sp.]MCW5845683.1 fumarylacetoacetate hydrolase family protein [Anaerolineae bacterium]